MESVTVLYADFLPNDTSNDMFVVTPEGNRFKFDAPIYTENHEDIIHDLNKSKYLETLS